MAVDKLVDSSQLDSNLTAVANAIRNKTGQSGRLSFPTGMVNAIASIQTGGGSSTPTAPRLQAKTATPSLSNQMVEPDSGYDGLSSVSVWAITQELLASLDADFVASNIKKGVNLFGLIGTYEGTGGGSDSGGGSEGGGESTGPVSVGTSTKNLTAAASSIQFTGLIGRPTSFVVISKGTLATGASPYKVACVVYDGTNVIGQYITNTSNAQMTYSATAFTQSYSNGTLTITASGANFQANEYHMIYSYGGDSSNIHTMDVQVGSGATQIQFTGLEGRPKYFSCIFKGNFSTSSGYARTNAYAADMENLEVYGLYMNSSDVASGGDSWSSKHNSGVLTITSTSTTDGGYFHQPGYYQLTYVV